MTKRRGFVRLKVMAVVLTAAILIYRLLRVTSLEFITDITNLFTDKVANMFLSSKTSERIYAAALQRLKLKFTEAQAKVLAELMVQQSKYETANYTSNVLRNNQNAFGYKYFKRSIYQVGQGTVSPELNSYGKYSDVADSAREVADWIGRRKPSFVNVQTEKQYAVAMKSHDYFGQAASAYASGLYLYENRV